MKLRIQNDSLRLRLNRQDVASLLETGRVESAIRFSATRSLGYALITVRAATAVSVNYDGESISVTLPEPKAKQWATSPQEISIQGADSGVQILVEKDFQCLHGTGEPDPLGFRNPLT